MVRAVIFDLFETLITELRTQPPGVSSLAPQFGCERAAFRAQWKALRPAVTAGRVSFRQALSDIAARLGRHADDATLQRICGDRIRVKAEPFETIEPRILKMIDDLRGLNLRIGVISNCFAEDVTSWARCSLASRVDHTVFSCDTGLAKPDPAIYTAAARRLGVDPSEAWFIGDGGDQELSGAEEAGLRAFKALWFLRQWPHFRESPGSAASVASPDDVVAMVSDESIRTNR
jgi:putative hydrolase of the HAD superfamily